MAGNRRSESKYLVISRRAFLGCSATALAGLGAGTGALFPSEAKRYADPATEFELYRLTDPSHQSLLPAFYGRAISHHGNFLIFSDDRSGAMQAYRMDLKTGQSRELTGATGLIPATLTLMPDEKSICYVEGRSLRISNLGSLHVRDVYQVPEGFEAAGDFGLTDDGLYGLLTERKADRFRLRLIPIRAGGSTTIVETADPLSDPIPRPRRAGILYRRGGELWLVNFDGAQNRRLRLAAGGQGPGLWSADGKQVLYLNIPQDRKQLNNLCEFTPDANEDRLVARTSQFVHFGRNSDGSVIAGASGSKASPYVLLLVRSVKRELTVCEHKASDPARVAPIFSPNSQRIFFQSDRDGKWAIYSMSVEKLVSETEVE